MSRMPSREEVVFAGVLAQPEEARATFLDEACCGDTDFFRRIAGLLDKPGGMDTRVRSSHCIKHAAAPPLFSATSCVAVTQKPKAMNTLRHLVVLVATMVVLSGPVFAQDLPKAEKHPNPRFYTAYYIKFKPGKVDEGRKIITDFFEVAGKNSDNRAIAFNYQSGNWHHVVYFPWTAASDLEWKMSPAGERWWAELAKHVGGAQKARELMAKWVDLVADEKWEITLRST